MLPNAAPYLARLSISLPADCWPTRRDDRRRGLAHRSQMIAELIRHELAEHSESQAGVVIAGTITLIYRAESGRVRHALAQTQLAFLKEVISSQHVFFEEDQSLEVLLVQGPAERLRSSATTCARSAACSRSSWSPPPPCCRRCTPTAPRGGPTAAGRR